MLQWTVVRMHTPNLHWCMLVCGYRVLSVVITYIAAVYTVTLLHLLYKSVLDPMHFSSEIWSVITMRLEDIIRQFSNIFTAPTQ